MLGSSWVHTPLQGFRCLSSDVNTLQYAAAAPRSTDSIHIEGEGSKTQRYPGFHGDPEETPWQGHLFQLRSYTLEQYLSLWHYIHLVLRFILNWLYHTWEVL